MSQRWLVRHGWILGVLGIYVLLISALHIGCPIRFVTEIPCPFCGMTRAWICALHFRFSEALIFHPLFWLGPPLVWFSLHENVGPLQRVKPNIKTGILVSGAVLFFVVYLFRLGVQSIP